MTARPTESEAQQGAQAAVDLAVDQAVASGGAYEVLQKRLAEQGGALRSIAAELNARRLEEFGSSHMELLGRLRVRTENNCVGRDIVQVGGWLLFGYNVFIGLKQQTRVEDVFALYRLEEGEQGYDVVPVDMAQSFLGQQSFVQDFTELYTYYKGARLLQLMFKEGKLLASFQIGERLSDIRVFRWSVSADGQNIRYIDNRGERDVSLPAPFDFEWTRTGREDVVQGRHPHINVLDTVFIDTVGGDLTVKIENNTNDGLGIWREAVQDATQSLDDAQIEYAKVGSLILLKILPYREERWRYLVYNTLTQKVVRNDAIGLACIQLPEDHGIIFPGGYVLQNGEQHAFGQSMEGMRYRRALRSPNGEDVLYIFYEPGSGRIALFTYNLIERQLQPPIMGHGYARLDDGRMVIFSSESNEPTRIHPMQIWRTPFATEEFAASQPVKDTPLGRIGNAELVRGISELYSLVREIDAEEVSSRRYERLIDSTRRLFERYHWMEQGGHFQRLPRLLHEIVASGEAVLDEYEKVESIRADTSRQMNEAATRQRSLLAEIRRGDWRQARDYVQALGQISQQRGRLMSIGELRYVDGGAVDAMQAELEAAHADVAARTAAFLADDEALKPYVEGLKALDEQVQKAETTPQVGEPLAGMQAMSAELDTLSELMAVLQVDDPTQRTRITHGISEIYAALNQSRARAEQKRRGMGAAEQVAQFGAQFALFGQSIASALALATDPEKCDEQLARLLVQLEELESQFGEHEQFLGDIIGKREELLETFESHKQALLDERQRKAQAVFDAALRILEGLPRRTERMDSQDALNAFFAGDALILKLRELGERLRALHDNVKADDLQARLGGIRDQAVRALRDRSDLFEGGGSVIRLGRHRFSVNTQALDLTLMPRGDALNLHLVGTDYMEPLQLPELAELREYWDVSLESESPQLYRAEYLALQMLEAARGQRVAGETSAAQGDGAKTFSRDQLVALLPKPDELVRAVREFAAPRYREGYERGIHDHDAALILQALLPLQEQAGVLTHDAQARALAVLLWNELEAGSDNVFKIAAQARHWPARAQSAATLRRLLASGDAHDALVREIAQALVHFAQGNQLTHFTGDAQAPLAALAEQGAEYLAEELAQPSPRLHFSNHAAALLQALRERVQEGGHGGHWAGLEQALHDASQPLAARFALALDWLRALARQPQQVANAAYATEAAALALLHAELPHQVLQVNLRSRIQGLLGQHPRIHEGTLELGVDDFSRRAHWHTSHFVPGLHRYQQLRHDILARQRDAMRLDEFKPRPLASFVRNKLINDVYLGVIGDNLAKQMGTVGENKRTDLMGLLMMISPPGYGKTTLMEYVANRLGLIFMKINGPALGHEVRSLDPAQAPDATARQELEKLNLALEMGNNIMLYVDDIQHTHPEFLQKFISLSDGTRRIEGVWRGRTRTYDMRGKKFCVVMAGNPYTESGEVFKIPDMLANRADVYNLGDVLGGMEETFKLSYIENSLTSNPVLAPLATRDLKDLYLLVGKVQGREFSSNELSHDYSAAELREIEAVLERMLKVREVVYRVNQQYIASAGQADAYRTEPPFKLQGSYRNMNKLAEKITSVMNEAEMQQLLDDHYAGESQLLTTGAEENLLKLAELRGHMGEEQQQRWQEIKRNFQRAQAIGGADTDTGGKIVAQLIDLVEATRQAAALEAEASQQPAAPWADLLASLQQLAAVQEQSSQALGHTVGEALRHTAPKAPEDTDAQAAQADQASRLLAARELGNLVASALQPVQDHLANNRRQQLGLHRVLLQIATAIQEQLDILSRTAQAQSGERLRHTEVVDKAFERMNREDE
ncbi:AAA family ATPase [Corticibacter populi]|uniref:AAA family ATPase n=1 Tax=Corticibacter populi TaxID=1550736 RepID=A0A3M6QT72_9BURK|nr:DNA repair ATPase [Corticibacter populi]RMX05672.1 AAA family ATPase [Corticibacter populi]RZS31044.1 ATPase family protein associated with various cellular activities (AAA) [Corticibacter populi]